MKTTCTIKDVKQTIAKKKWVTLVTWDKNRKTGVFSHLGSSHSISICSPWAQNSSSLTNSKLWSSVVSFLMQPWVYEKSNPRSLKNKIYSFESKATKLQSVASLLSSVGGWSGVVVLRYRRFLYNFSSLSSFCPEGNNSMISVSSFSAWICVFLSSRCWCRCSWVIGLDNFLAVWPSGILIVLPEVETCRGIEARCTVGYSVVVSQRFRLFLTTNEPCFDVDERDNILRVNSYSPSFASRMIWAYVSRFLRCASLTCYDSYCAPCEGGQ